MIDPVMFRQLTEIKHEERLEHYARPRQHRAAQPTPPLAVAQQVPTWWTALLTRLNLATGR